MVPLVLVLNLTTCISSKFGHRVTPLAIVWNLADSWLHFHQLEICPPGNTKSIINRIGLCLVMQIMILTMVYLSWWAGSVQWRLQSLYDEVKIRRHVDKIYYLCLLKTLRQSHQWWHQESSIPCQPPCHPPCKFPAIHLQQNKTKCFP